MNDTRRGKHIKRLMRLLSIGWIGLVMLLVGAGGGLVIALVEGNRGNDIGSYLMPRTIGHAKNTGEQREETNMR